ncbi:MAG TPA: phosphotransferase, partial [Gemmatimonadaceae bacterium]|nr:phosphotransferase [Gemmatimonadaceae bacterium]
MSTISVFELPKPELAAAELAALLRTHFGLEGAMTPLVSERDQNMLVEAAGRSCVLKIANAAEDRGALDLQNALLDHIAATSPTLGVPRLVRARDGREIAEWRSGAAPHYVRVFEYLPGQLFSQVPKTPALLASLGRFMGRFSASRKGFGHPVAHRPHFLWNLDEALAVKPWLDDIADSDERALAARIFARYETRAVPRLRALRAGVLHQDANDNNLIVSDDGSTVTGLIDFGDMTFGRQVNELAVTLAYALLDQDDLYAAAASVIGGYASEFPLEADECEVLFDLVATRLAVSVCVSSHRGRDFPGNEYLQISRAPALRMLYRIDRTNPAFLAEFARQCSGIAPVADHDRIVTWLRSDACAPRPLFDFELDRAARCLVSLKEGAPGMEHATDADAYWEWLRKRMRSEGARFAIGTYGEIRDVYAGEQFRTPASPERRTQHLGVDLFIEAGT